MTLYPKNDLSFFQKCVMRSKMMSVSQAGILKVVHILISSDDPVLILHSMDYGHPMKHFFIEIPNF